MLIKYKTYPPSCQCKKAISSWIYPATNAVVSLTPQGIHSEGRQQHKLLPNHMADVRKALIHPSLPSPVMKGKDIPWIMALLPVFVHCLISNKSEIMNYMDDAIVYQDS